MDKPLAPANELAQNSSTIPYVVSLDIACDKITGAILKSDKTLALKPIDFDNGLVGYQWLETQLQKLGTDPRQMMIGLEATARYWENCYYYFAAKDYQMVLLHPQQTHQWAERRGLRAKTDKLDSLTIGRVLLSGEAKACYVPSEQIVAYRQLVRMQARVSKELTRYKNEIHALQVVLFPEFTRCLRMDAVLPP